MVKTFHSLKSVVSYIIGKKCILWQTRWKFNILLILITNMAIFIWLDQSCYWSNKIQKKSRIRKAYHPSRIHPFHNLPYSYPSPCSSPSFPAASTYCPYSFHKSLDSFHDFQDSSQPDPSSCLSSPEHSYHLPSTFFPFASASAQSVFHEPPYSYP